MDEKKMTVKELRSKIGVSFPKGLSKANYDYESFMSNEMTEIEKEKEKILDEINNILNNIDNLDKQEIFKSLQTIIDEHD